MGRGGKELVMDKKRIYTNTNIHVRKRRGFRFNLSGVRGREREKERREEKWVSTGDK
jgi:hypothetical protein